MVRRILFLCNPGEGSNFAPQVYLSINQYKTFFKSPFGGAWKEEEFLELPEKMTSEQKFQWLKKTMLYLNSKDCDYSIIIFVGHGGAWDNIDIVELWKGKLVAVDFFTKVSSGSKRTVLIDACRVNVIPDRIPIEEERMFSGGYVEDINFIRDKYNAIINNQPPHIELVQSTSKGDVAKTNSLGTIFSENVFRAIQQNKDDWALYALEHNSGLIVKPWCELIGDITKLMSSSGQVPQFISSIDNDKSFPFYIDWIPIVKTIRTGDDSIIDFYS